MWPRIPVAGRHQVLPDDDSRVVENEYRPGFDRGQTALFFVARLQPAQRDRLIQQVPTALIARVWQSKCDSNGQATWPSARGKMRRRLAGARSPGRTGSTQGHRLVGSAKSVGWDQRCFTAPAHLTPDRFETSRRRATEYAEIAGIVRTKGSGLQPLFARFRLPSETSFLARRAAGCSPRREPWGTAQTHRSAPEGRHIRGALHAAPAFAKKPASAAPSGLMTVRFGPHPRLTPWATTCHTPG